MPIEQMLAFFVFSLVAAGTPGPSNIILTAIGANVGTAKGFPSVLGATSGMALMMFLVSYGLGSVILNHPGLLKVLNWCGAAFLLWLSWKIATVNRVETSTEKNPVGFVGMMLFQAVNPKAWLVCASAAGTFLSAGAGSPLLQSISLGGIFFIASTPCCFLWLVFGAAIQRLLTDQRRLRIFNISMGVLLAVSVVLMVF